MLATSVAVASMVAMLAGTSTLGRAVSFLLSILAVALLLCLLYYYILLIASAWPHRSPAPATSHSVSFAIAIPAHNEESVLAETLRWLSRLEYPAAQYDVYVVADHCTDHTAQVARAHGAICYERQEGPRGRKAYALQWLVQRILDGGRDYDALLVFDADSHVHAGFLRAMSGALAQDGALVLQGKHVIIESPGNWFGGLASVDMRLNNLLRNQAKHNLGLSCRLMGDAMCFSFTIMRQFGWPTDSLGEDREFGLFLLTQGLRVGYVPQALSYGQAAPDWRAASQQRVRWYGGARQIRRRYALRLLGQALRARRAAILDGALELWMPPISVMTLLSILLAAIQVALPSLGLFPPVGVGLAAMLLWVLLPFWGLLIDRAPSHTFRALLYSPAYLVWRLYVGLVGRLGRNVQWVRTRRREES